MAPSAVWLLLALACHHTPPAPPAPPPPGAAPLSTAVASSPPVLRSELAVEGGLKKRLSSSPSDLTIFYAGEHKGSLETCGCPKNPRGSFARLASYVQAARATTPADLLVHAGYWLDEPVDYEANPRADLLLQDRYLIQGLHAFPWDALNVGLPDLAALALLGPEAAKGLPLVSASYEGPEIAPFLLFSRGGKTIGVTGLSDPGPLPVPAPYRHRSGREQDATLYALEQQADVVVVLAHMASAEVGRITADHPRVDVWVDAAAHRERSEPTWEHHTVVVSSHYQTMRLGELRLTLDAGVVTSALDRKIDLDASIPDDPALAALTAEARAAIDAEQQRLYGAGGP